MRQEVDPFLWVYSLGTTSFQLIKYYLKFENEYIVYKIESEWFVN